MSPGELTGDDLKARLLAKRTDTASGLPEDSYDVPGIGTVLVRGMSRGEVFAMQKSKSDGGIKDEGAWERRLLSIALVDPPMTEAEVGEWQRVSQAGEIEPVTKLVHRLSGLDEGAEKSGVPGVGAQPGSGVRALPGPEAVDDGGPAAGADER